MQMRVTVFSPVVGEHGQLGDVRKAPLSSTCTFHTYLIIAHKITVKIRT